MCGGRDSRDFDAKSVSGFVFHVSRAEAGEGDEDTSKLQIPRGLMSVRDDNKKLWWKCAPEWRVWQEHKQLQIPRGLASARDDNKKLRWKCLKPLIRRKHDRAPSTRPCAPWTFAQGRLSLRVTAVVGGNAWTRMTHAPLFGLLYNREFTLRA